MQLNLPVIKKGRQQIRQELEAFNYTPEKQGVTISLLNLWLSCEVAARMLQKGYYWPSKGKSQVQGSVIHHGLDHFYTGFMNGTVSGIDQILEETQHPMFLLKKFDEDFNKEYLESDVETQIEYQTAYGVGAALVPEYFKYWNKDFDRKKIQWLEIERKAKFIHKATGIPIRMKRDGAFKKLDTGTFHLFESKSKDKFNETQLVNHASRNMQNLTYLLGMQDEYHHTPSGILLNVVRRPQLRIKQKETLQAFVIRFRDDIRDRPDFYFIRKPLPVLPQRLQAHDQKLTRILNRFVKWWYSPESEDIDDTERCFPYNKPCPYLKYCTSGKNNTDGLLVKKDTSDSYFNIGGDIEDV